MRAGLRSTIPVLVAASTVGVVLTGAQQRTGSPFPGGTNPDGSLRPTPPLSQLFTQDAYTEYAILEPGSE